LKKSPLKGGKVLKNSAPRGPILLKIYTENEEERACCSDEDLVGYEEVPEEDAGRKGCPGQSGEQDDFL
jgi:hypothetical protein